MSTSTRANYFSFVLILRTSFPKNFLFYRIFVSVFVLFVIFHCISCFEFFCSFPYSEFFSISITRRIDHYSTCIIFLSCRSPFFTFSFNSGNYRFVTFWTHLQKVSFFNNLCSFFYSDLLNRFFFSTSQMF